MPFEKGLHKGHIFRKGKESPIKLKKIDLFKKGLDINCKKHGSHTRWRLHSDNNVQCLFCASEWQMNQRRRNPLRFIYRDAKKHALYHKREFTIELKDLENLIEKQDNKCELTGIEFNNDDTPPSLDRIDSKKGYTPNNIQLIQIKINIMKSNFNQNDFINLCKQVISFAEARGNKKKSKKK